MMVRLRLGYERLSEGAIYDPLQGGYLAYIYKRYKSFSGGINSDNSMPIRLPATVKKRNTAFWNINI